MGPLLRFDQQEIAEFIDSNRVPAQTRPHELPLFRAHGARHTRSAARVVREVEMRGHVRNRGNKWAFVVDVSKATKVQREAAEVVQRLHNQEGR